MSLKLPTTSSVVNKLVQNERGRKGSSSNKKSKKESECKLMEFQEKMKDSIKRTGKLNKSG